MKCPICNAELSEHSRGVTFHARQHGIGLDTLWCLLNGVRPTCQCKPECNAQTNWISWTKGFKQYAVGHYPVDIRRQRASEVMSGPAHWSRGKTKYDDERLAACADKITNTLKDGYASGRIMHWSRGKTASTDDRIAAAVKQRAIAYRHKSHPRFMSIELIRERVAIACCDNFTVKIDDEIVDRVNNRTCLLDITCKRCGRKDVKSIYGIIRGMLKCASCDHVSSSMGERDIATFIRSFGLDVQHRVNVNGVEIDVYVPTCHFGIEFNGLYWHSNAVCNDHLLHEKKTDACQTVDVRLMHVFEDDWRDRNDIVKSMIAAKLGVFEHVVDARKCTVVQLDLQTRREFFEANHVDGDVSACEAYGLVYDGHLVSCISLRRPNSGRRNCQFEIARFASYLRTNVRGGFGKLITHVRRLHPDASFVTYVDRRFGGSGIHYKHAGFELSGKTTQRFWWTDTINRYGRLTVRADGDAGLSEDDVSVLKRKLKIWGTSNLRFELHPVTIPHARCMI